MSFSLGPLLNTLLFILIIWTLVSYFLVWQWFDARERLKVVRETTREETLRAIRHSYSRCTQLMKIGWGIAGVFVFLPFIEHDYYGTLYYSGVVIFADALVWYGLKKARDNYIDSIDDFVNENEEHVREATAERERMRDEWKRQAPELNRQADIEIKELLGDNYDVWFKHDILKSRDVLVNNEEELLYAQGVVVPFKDIMEVRQGRKDLKLVTSNSLNPFVTIDFGSLPINPETGNKYKDEIAEKLEQVMR